MPVQRGADTRCGCRRHSAGDSSPKPHRRDRRALEAEKARKATWTKRLGPLAPIVFFLAKAKTFLFAILKFKFLLSFIAFFGLYWGLFGWKFGLGFTVSILIHELGHYSLRSAAASRSICRYSCPASELRPLVQHGHITGRALQAFAAQAPPPDFSPQPHAELSRSRPASDQALSGALAHAGAWLNLANLVPVLGGRAQATHALNRTQRWLIFATCVIFFAFLKKGVFLFIAAGMFWRAVTGTPGAAQQRNDDRYMLLLFLYLSPHTLPPLQLKSHLIDKAPVPGFAGLDRLHDRVLRGLEVLGGMLTD